MFQAVWLWSWSSLSASCFWHPQRYNTDRQNLFLFFPNKLSYRFMRGLLNMFPLIPHILPQWSLSLVLLLFNESTLWTFNFLFTGFFGLRSCIFVVITSLSRFSEPSTLRVDPLISIFFRTRWFFTLVYMLPVKDCS